MHYQCGIVSAILILCDLLSIFFKMASSYMEWSIFDSILAHRSFETMFLKGRSPLLFKMADVSKTVFWSEAKKVLNVTLIHLQL